MNSIFLRLNSKDFLKGAIVAICSALYPLIQSFLNGGTFDTTLAWKLALGSFVGYLVKNFLSDEQGNPLGIGSNK